MKTLYTDNPGQIKDELNQLISDKIKIIFVYKQSNRKKLYAKGTVQADTGSLLILYFPEDFSEFDKSCTCYYHIPGAPLRGFSCKPKKKADDFLGIEFPHKIFELQRRKHPRVPTPKGSTGSFSVKNRSRVLSCNVADISLEGARIYGELPTIILKNDILTPVCLDLTQRFNLQHEVNLLIQEATVTWSTCSDEKTEMLGINFSLTGDEYSVLENYIDIRVIEDTRSS